MRKRNRMQIDFAAVNQAARREVRYNTAAPIRTNAPAIRHRPDGLNRQQSSGPAFGGSPGRIRQLPWRARVTRMNSRTARYASLSDPDFNYYFRHIRRSPCRRPPLTRK
jgi:hypothetical protein